MKALFLFFHNHKPRTSRIALFWTLLILLACLIPGREVPDVQVPLADKWVHFVLFAAFSFLWICTFRRTGLKAGLIVGLLSVLFGYVVELLQGSGITEGRSYDLYDVLADGIGGLLGLAVFFLLRSYALKTP